MYYRLQRNQIIPKPLADVFSFFSDARNLGRLTPDWLKFQILNPEPIDMKPGTLIDYQIRWMGLPLHWKTEIIEWQPNRWFTDCQRKGPYKFWVHTHTFEKLDGNTLMQDIVDYQLRFGVLGTLAHSLIIRKQVHDIFDFRARKIEELFG